MLGNTLDIHGGGADLQFPHHENEIAQSEGALGCTFVRYWMHNGFVRVDNEKMSKSLGNFFTIREVLKKFDPEVVRLFILRAHYRSPLNYSDAHLEDARNSLLRLYNALGEGRSDPGAFASLDPQAPAVRRFREAMEDDFNTPVALSVLFDLAGELNRGSRSGDRNPAARARWRARAAGPGPGAGAAERPARQRGDGRRRRLRCGDRRTDRGTGRGEEGEGLRAGRPDPGAASRRRDRPGRHARRHDVAARLRAITLSKPDFWDQACTELSSSDPVLARIIGAYGNAHLTSRGDPFLTLARSIVGQQISVKAAQAVWDRVLKAARELSPDRVCRMRVSTLRACGLSERKVEYVKDLASRFRSGAIDPVGWDALDDDAIIEQLVEVRGIGRWTAEMFLMFNLMRPDVYPIDDLGLLRAIQVNYEGEGGYHPLAEPLQGKPHRQRAIEIGERWRPWRTVATWYLWRSLDPLPTEY